MALTYEDIAQEFKNKVDSDPKVQQYLKTIRSGNGTYVTANKLAVRVGEDLGKVLKMHEPIDGISEWDYVDLIPKALGLDQQMVVDACREVQEGMNKKAGLGIKYKEPAFNMDRVSGLITELADNPEFTNISKSFYDQLVNFSESIVDDSIRDNAGVLFRAGIRTMVIRQAEFGGCRWCQDVAGSYDYNDVKETGNDVWRQHENCRCTIDYITERSGSFYSEKVNNQKK